MSCSVSSHTLAAKFSSLSSICYLVTYWLDPAKLKYGKHGTVLSVGGGVAELWLLKGQKKLNTVEQEIFAFI